MSSSARPDIIFFGNGPLADTALKVLKSSCNILFHARTKEDLTTVKKLKAEHPEAYGVLASYGVIIKSDVLELFEPTGILNIHPSALPDLRGPSPIESAILRGNTNFTVSIMKLAPQMDAGPIYSQQTLPNLLDPNIATPDIKPQIYHALATAGATWISQYLTSLPTPVSQDHSLATFCEKLNKSMSPLDPTTKSAKQLIREIIAFTGFPKSKYTFYGHECIIHSAHCLKNHSSSTAAPSQNPLTLVCADGTLLSIDELQPAGKKRMDAKSFLNGYTKG